MNTPRKHTKRPFRRRKSARPSFLSRVLQFGAYLLVFALGGCYLRVASHGGSWPFRTEASDAVDKLGRHVGGLQRKFGGLGSQGFQVLESEKGDQHNQVNKGGQKQSESIQGDHQIEEAVIQRADQREKKLQEEQDALGVDTSDEADNGLWEGDSTAERESAVQASEERNNKGFKRSFQLPSRRRQKASGLVSRVAVGSCTARTDIPQPVWEQAVIPSEPDAWIWAGDLAYLDWPDVDCRASPEHPNCDCEKDWLKSSHQSCLSGDMTHARAKLRAQLEHPDYVRFLRYMCPAWQPHGLFGPDGADPALCPRTILGTWDDHDYNWQDGNRRLPRKEAQKQLYLDALGVRRDDPRREVGRGLYAKHTLNQGVAGKEIDVFLLDGRYYRDPKPCALRREFCEKMVLTDPKKDKYAWCHDFLHGGRNGTGSCCKKDDAFRDGWCRHESSRNDFLWASACDPTSASFGQIRTRLKWQDHLDRMGLVRVENESGEGANESGEEEEEGGTMCEVLGHEQRLWLTTELRASRAPLKLVVVGSPVFNNPSQIPCKGKVPKGLTAPVTCPCFDDFDCYRPAQVALLHALASAPGCPVVITGDFHFSDLKVLRPGKSLYSEEYQSERLAKPVYQVMASGLTVDTAKPATCQGFHRDRMGLRVPGECDFVAGPAFGMVEVDWEQEMVSLQIRDGNEGEVRVETSFHLGTCLEKASLTERI